MRVYSPLLGGGLRWPVGHPCFCTLKVLSFPWQLMLILVCFVDLGVQLSRAHGDNLITVPVYNLISQFVDQRQDGVRLFGRPVGVEF